MDDSPIILPTPHECRELLKAHLTALLAIGMDLHDTPEGYAVGVHAAALLPVLCFFSRLDAPPDEGALDAAA